MRILMIGDIVGQPGKHACSQIVPRLIREWRLDLVVANAENASAGSGLTPGMFSKLMNYGIDACTMGDHIYKRREIIPLLETSDRIVKPANYPPEAKGREMIVVQGKNGAKAAVISLMGRIFMNNVRADCPFHAVDRLLGLLAADVKIVIVDVHAETTSEKVAMGWHLDGRATLVAGSHTHVQTADERVLPRGTAYITDLGMTGPHDSVLGRKKDRVLRSLITGMPYAYDVAEGDTRLNGVLVEADPATGRAKRIERVSLADESPMAAGSDEET